MRRTGVAVVAGAVVVLVGCLLAPSAVAAQTTATETDMDGDSEECMRGPHPYAACMIARGYRVVVMNFGTVDANVEAVRPLLPDAIATDLNECREVAEARANALEAKSPVILPASGHGSVNGLMEELDRVYGACLTPRGYKVTPWDGH